jgi:hypothetical protein
VPMTVEQFALPFHRLVLAYDRFAFVKDDDQQLLTEDWYASFKKYNADLWARGVEEWKAGRPKFPAQSEMHDHLLFLAPVMVREHEEEERRQRLAAAPPIDPAKLADLRERLRGLQEQKQLRFPVVDVPRLEDGDDR